MQKKDRVVKKAAEKGLSGVEYMAKKLPLP